MDHPNRAGEVAGDGGSGRRRGSLRPVPRPEPLLAAPPLASRGRPVGRGRSFLILHEPTPVSSQRLSQTEPTNVPTPSAGALMPEPPTTLVATTFDAGSRRRTPPVIRRVNVAMTRRTVMPTRLSSAALRADPEGADLGRPAAGDGAAQADRRGTDYAESWEIVRLPRSGERRQRRPPGRDEPARAGPVRVPWSSWDRPRAARPVPAAGQVHRRPSGLYRSRSTPTTRGAGAWPTTTARPRPG